MENLTIKRAYAKSKLYGKNQQLVLGQHNVKVLEETATSYYLQLDAVFSLSSAKLRVEKSNVVVSNYTVGQTIEHRKFGTCTISNICCTSHLVLTETNGTTHIVPFELI